MPCVVCSEKPPTTPQDVRAQEGDIQHVGLFCEHAAAWLCRIANQKVRWWGGEEARCESKNQNSYGATEHGWMPSMNVDTRFNDISMRKKKHHVVACTIRVHFTSTLWTNIFSFCAALFFLLKIIHKQVSLSRKDRRPLLPFEVHRELCWINGASRFTSKKHTFLSGFIQKENGCKCRRDQIPRLPPA